MNKTYLIFKHEFLQTIKKGGWIIMTLAVPVLALLGIGLISLMNNISDSGTDSVGSIAYVDEAGIITTSNTEEETMLIPYNSVDDAKEAMLNSEISEYILIPEDYTSTGIIHRYTLEKELGTSPLTIALIKSFLTRNLLKDQVSPHLISLINSPLKLQVTRVTQEGDISKEQNSMANLLVPGIFSLLLGLSLMIGSMSLITGLGEEKESRLIEVLFSSVSIRQLLVGKVLALGTAGLLQVLLWLITAPFLVDLAVSASGGAIGSIQIPGSFLVLGIVYFILGYLLFAVLSIGVGAISNNGQEGSQLSMIYTMANFIPLWFAALLIAFPKSPIWIILTLFPITAPVQTMVRLGVSDIPSWQILASIIILLISILGGLSIAIKIFRMNMLMHGKRPGLTEIIHSLKKA
ncbi:MAG: ABC transporter permease [Bacteroidetes bacterium]|jgi:ABC-2 type transport system permease protein|nr:ABC transporter permease [Bacteroidota bacterium]MBT4401811.1 ABC transporter permease [Bacteroidota bacterium]MBT4410259.1 ABC transporter permease [Bacteroidota bacterium]MBT5426425.1 ABC transporter permease [Bacteroidota bacterium]MBT7092040.1 ABC transporter permease [Bacteroidota bacterium]